MSIVIGIDPDSDAHGVAFYEDGKLFDLREMRLGEILEFCIRQLHEDYDVLVSIEDVISNKFIYARNVHSNSKVQSTIAMSIGRNQQSQVELERELTRHGIKYINFKPQKGNWAENKDQFEKVTGWDKRSNKDTRSAAFFGYLALKK